MTLFINLERWNEPEETGFSRVHEFQIHRFNQPWLFPFLAFLRSTSQDFQMA
jgi:hypothetical protein